MIKPRTRTVISRMALLALVGLVSHLAVTDRSYAGVESLNDKVSHILAFGALALAADFSFPRRQFLPGTALALVGYGVLIEVVQYFLPYRDCSALDVLADSVGIAAYALGFPLLRHVPVLRSLWSLRQQY